MLGGDFAQLGKCRLRLSDEILFSLDTVESGVSPKYMYVLDRPRVNRWLTSV